MRRLRELDGSNVHRRYIRFHLSACKGASPLHDALYAEASVIYAGLRDAERAHEDAKDAATSASAVLSRAEVNLENAIREVDAAARKLDRKDRALAAQRSIFPAGLGPEIRPDGQAQLAVLPALRIRMAPFANMGDMDEAIANLDHAEMQHREALATVDLAATEVDRRFAEEREARKAVRAQLESAYGRLKDHYKLYPASAETFFLREKAPTQPKTKQPVNGASAPSPSASLPA